MCDEYAPQASDKKIQKWIEILSANDSDVLFTLGIAKGTVWHTKPPYPELKAVESEEIQVRRFVRQKMILEASAPEDGAAAHITVNRFVAELENGDEYELFNMITPSEQEEVTYPDDVCFGCGEKIPDESEAVLFGKRYYHKRCME